MNDRELVEPLDAPYTLSKQTARRRENPKGKARLRVLHLIPSFAGGGAERQLALLAPNLCRLGVEIHVSYVRPGVNFELISGSDVTFHPLSSWGNHDPAILFRVLRVIRSVKPDLIQTWFHQMDVFGGVAAILAGIPFVLSERSSALAYPITFKNWLRLQIGRHATAIVANSESGAAYWTGRANAARLAVIRNGLPLDRLRTTVPANPVDVGLRSDAKLILFAGRLSPEKNLDTLIQGMDEVLVSHPDCAAILFGEGPLRAAVESRIAKARAHERIRLQGFTRELWRWMRRATVFISLSHFEGSPNAVQEAMAVECPLVVSNIPQHREILDDTTALFCDQNSVAEVATAIRMVLSDPAAAAARADAARRRSAAWTVEETSRQYLRLYETLTVRRRATG